MSDAWELSEELRTLQDTVRRFMDQEVRPAEDKVEHDSMTLLPEDLARLRGMTRDMGLWCYQTAEEYGGAGLSLMGQVIMAEETAKCRMGAYNPACGAFGSNPPNAIFGGTPEQIEKYAMPVIRGEGRAFIALTEPGGGADPRRAIATKAVRKGDKYILNGTKVFITGVGEATWGLLFARTEDDKISCFIVEPGKPGFECTPIPVIRAYYPYEIHLVDYELPAENLLGAEGEGFTLAQEWLVHGRVPYAAACIGIAQESLRLAIEWAGQRETFGSLLSDKQAIQWMIADSEIELRAARLLVYQAAWNGELGKDIKIDASIAKVYATETAGRVVDRCIQIFGGLGVSKEMPLERWYREMRIKRIGEGPSEVHRMVLARDLLRDARRKK